MTRGAEASYIASTLPSNWWHDEDFRAYKHRQIRASLSAGYSFRETAAATGVSEPTVARMAAKMKRESR